MPFSFSSRFAKQQRERRIRQAQIPTSLGSQAASMGNYGAVSRSDDLEERKSAPLVAVVSEHKQPSQLSNNPNIKWVRNRSASTTKYGVAATICFLLFIAAAILNTKKSITETDPMVSPVLTTSSILMFFFGLGCCSLALPAELKRNSELDLPIHIRSRL